MVPPTADSAVGSDAPPTARVRMCLSIDTGCRREPRRGPDPRQPFGCPLGSGAGSGERLSRVLRYANTAALRRQWLLIAVFAVLGAVGAFAFSATLTPLYRATASLYFTLNFGNTANDMAQGSTYTANQMVSFGMLATSPVVLDGVIHDLDLDLTANELARLVAITTPRDTVVMAITAESANPASAANIANTVAAHTKRVVEAFAPQRENGKSTVTARVIEQATPPRFQFSPDKRLNSLLGFVLGLLIGMLVAFARTVLDNRVRSQSSLEAVSETTFLGGLRSRGESRGSEAVVLQAPTSHAADDYRKLRTNLRFATLSKHPLALVVSSSVPQEGKSTVSVNLASALAESGQRVLLIDADLRRPQLANYSHIDGTVGLTDVLVNQVNLPDAVVPLGDSGVHVLAAGSPAPNPGELLSSKQMSGVIQEGLTTYDAVIVDSAPILTVPDALALTQMCDGMIFVARSGKTHKKDVQRSLEAIRSAGGVVFGAVLNGTKVSRRKQTAYDYASDALPGRAVTETVLPREEDDNGDGDTDDAAPNLQPANDTDDAAPNPQPANEPARSPVTQVRPKARAGRR